MAQLRLLMRKSSFLLFKKGLAGHQVALGLIYSSRLECMRAVVGITINSIQGDRLLLFFSIHRHGLFLFLVARTALTDLQLQYIKAKSIDQSLVDPLTDLFCRYIDVGILVLLEIEDQLFVGSFLQP
jgi:hypothetical protein